MWEGRPMSSHALARRALESDTGEAMVRRGVFRVAIMWHAPRLSRREVGSALNEAPDGGEAMGGALLDDLEPGQRRLLHDLIVAELRPYFSEAAAHVKTLHDVYGLDDEPDPDAV